MSEENKYPDSGLDSSTNLDTEKEAFPAEPVCSASELPIPQEEIPETEASPELTISGNDVSETEETPDAQPQSEQSEFRRDTSFTDELQKQFVALLDPLMEKISAIQESFESKLKYDKHKNEIIDRQHKELEEFHSGLIRKVTLQMANDIIFEIDDTEKLFKFYEKTEFSEENYKKLLKMFLGFSEGLRDLLDKYEISSYCCEPGAVFNPKRQRAMKTTETAEIALDKTVKESLRWGFELDGKIIRPEMVNVYVYKKNDPLSSESQNETEKQ